MYPQETEANNLGIKKGTKLTDTPKDITLKFRMDQATEKKLLFVCSHTNKSKSEIIRRGIEQQYDAIEKK